MLLPRGDRDISFLTSEFLAGSANCLKSGCRWADQCGDRDLLGDWDQCEEVMLEHLMQIDSL